MDMFLGARTKFEFKRTDSGCLNIDTEPLENVSESADSLNSIVSGFSITLLIYHILALVLLGMLASGGDNKILSSDIKIDDYVFKWTYLGFGIETFLFILFAGLVGGAAGDLNGAKDTFETLAN